MSGWELATWAAIATLVLGPLAIFAWFLVDAARWLRAHPARRRRPADGGTEA